MIAGFVARNLAFSVQNVRKLPSVRRAMREYDEEVGNRCEFCFRTGDADVHHIRPVSVAPELAACKSNMICLCRKKGCHLVVGHLGNWKTWNMTVRATCRAATLGVKDAVVTEDT